MKPVYCTNCNFGRKLIRAIVKDKKIPTICKKCYPYDLEDSRDIKLRQNYMKLKR